MLVTWTLADPGAVGTRLAERLRLPRPDLDAEEVGFELDGGILRLVRSSHPVEGPSVAGLGVERLVVEMASLRSPAGSARIGLLGIGWATVELDRSAASVGAAFGLTAHAFQPASDDAWLGARARQAALPASGMVVLLEPRTEGRLAAALARSGEGPVAVYLGVPGPPVGATRPGPLGSAVILHGSRPWGPFVLGIARPEVSKSDAAGPPV
jgi:hypothetical protein